MLGSVITPCANRSLKDFFRVGRLLGHGMAGKVHECVDILTGKHFAVKEGLAHPADDFNGAHGLLNELRIMQLLDTCPYAPLLACSAAHGVAADRVPCYRMAGLSSCSMLHASAGRYNGHTIPGSKVRLCKQNRLHLLWLCRHRTLPKLHDAFRTKDGIIQIVMELMTGSNICVQLAKDVDFSEGQARDVFREITGMFMHSLGMCPALACNPTPCDLTGHTPSARSWLSCCSASQQLFLQFKVHGVRIRTLYLLSEGVAHLHELGISHRDLKPENIFYKDPSPSAQIMVLDFNLAKESHSATWGADTPCGTAGFQAPEILQHRMYNQVCLLSSPLWEGQDVLQGIPVS